MVLAFQNLRPGQNRGQAVTLAQLGLAHGLKLGHAHHYWYVQGSIYIMWNFKMKSWQLINFTVCAKDRGLAWKSNIQNYYIQLITPVWLLHDHHNISESPGQCWAKAIVMTHPHNLIFWRSQQLHTELYNSVAKQKLWCSSLSHHHFWTVAVQQPNHDQ